eukprot:575707-Rhodomonas_salina.1
MGRFFFVRAPDSAEGKRSSSPSIGGRAGQACETATSQSLAARSGWRQDEEEAADEEEDGGWRREDGGGTEVLRRVEEVTWKRKGGKEVVEEEGGEESEGAVTGVRNVDDAKMDGWMWSEDGSKQQLPITPPPRARAHWRERARAGGGGERGGMMRAGTAGGGRSTISGR